MECILRGGKSGRVVGLVIGAEKQEALWKWTVENVADDGGEDGEIGDC